jgi:hypothetical protein
MREFADHFFREKQGENFELSVVSPVKPEKNETHYFFTRLLGCSRTASSRGRRIRGNHLGSGRLCGRGWIGKPLDTATPA